MMNKPQIGDIVKLVGDQTEGFQDDTWRVYATYDDIDSWWDTATGENKVALMDALAEYGEEKAKTAEWYAEVENITAPGETMAVASFECEPAE
jgi:hypothetical protein